MNLNFHKYVGAGNDFVFLQDDSSIEKSNRPQMAIDLCNRQFGIGADGLVFIEKRSEDFAWDFYNSDGSEAEMCGNAARCAIKYIEKIFGQSTCQFETLAGIVLGEVHPMGAKASWEISSFNTKQFSVDLENFKTFAGDFVNTGVPHFVISNELVNITHEDCLAIQSHPQFGTAQTNVTLLDTVDGKNLTKTFERGVKDFTLACGTGVIASALVLAKSEKKDVYDLRAPGGDLKVQLSNNVVSLIGPAEYVYSGTMTYEKE